MCSCQPELRYDSFPYVRGKRLREEPELQAHLQRIVAQHQHTALRQGAQRQYGRRANADQVLSLKAEHLWAPMMYIWRLANIASFSAQMAVRRELVHHRLAAFVDPRIGRANVALMRMSDKGWQRTGKQPPQRRGNQDTPHEHAAHWIRTCKERQGHEAFCEYAVPETSTYYADVAHIVGEELHVWEVVYKCHANLTLHLRSCFLVSQAVSTATVVAFTKTQLTALRNLVRSEQSLTAYADRIKFEVVEPYMRKLYDAHR